MKRMKRLPSSDPNYDANWIARVKARCTVDANGCWLWPGTRSYNGYATSCYRSKHAVVHRKMFELANGVTLDRWIYACHTCDVRHCVNPAHVFTGTPKENQQDMSRKGRAGLQSITHCKHGHEFTPENTRRYPSTGRRNCLTCARIRQRVKDLGWSREEAEKTPVIPAHAKTERRKFGGKSAADSL